MDRWGAGFFEIRARPANAARVAFGVPPGALHRDVHPLPPKHDDPRASRRTIAREQPRVKAAVLAVVLIAAIPVAGCSPTSGDQQTSAESNSAPPTSGVGAS